MIQTYDHSAKDFHTFAIRRGLGFLKADKSKESGVATLNTLFKSGMLKLFDEDPEIEKLITEILSVKKTTAKSHAADDLLDALRYAAMAVPWDWSALEEIHEINGVVKEKPLPPPKTETDLRRDYFFDRHASMDYTHEKELNEWDELINEFDT